MQYRVFQVYLSGPQVGYMIPPYKKMNEICGFWCALNGVPSPFIENVLFHLSELLTTLFPWIGIDS